MTCQWCGATLPERKRLGRPSNAGRPRKYCPSPAPCKRAAEHAKRQERNTGYRRGMRDLSPAQIERAFLAAKARQQWARRVSGAA